MIPEKDPTLRFTSRVDDYDQHRPSYPESIISIFENGKILKHGDIVADIGCGTGISSRIFLNAGYEVWGIEPNTVMLSRATEKFHGCRFQAINRKAENTGLPDNSVDLAVAAQAFHWFNGIEAKNEMRRILRPSGFVALIWNNRLDHASAFNQAYEDLIHHYASDYDHVNHRNIDASRLMEFFGSPYETIHLENLQVMNLDGLKGRLASCSYLPAKGDVRYNSMMISTEELFNRYKVDDQVTLIYQTEIFLGKLK